MMKRLRIAISVLFALGLCVVFALGLCVVFALPAMADGGENITFYSDAADGFVRGDDNDWATCRGLVTGNVAQVAFDYLITMTDKVAESPYHIYRTFLMFDTSALPDACTITGATLSVYGRVDNQIEDNVGYADLAVFEGTQGDSITVEDFDAFNVTMLTDGTYSWENPLTTDDYNDAALNSDGWAVINKTGTTYFCLRVYSDYDNHVPTGYNRSDCWAQEEGAGFIPKLVVYYEVGGELLTFTATSYNGTYAFLEWTKTGSLNTDIRVSSVGYPADNVSGELVCSGNLTEYKYPCLAGTAKTFFFGAFMEGSDNLTASIGGEDVEMSIVLPTGFYVLMAGLVLLFISFFLKSPLIYLAVIPCMFGVLFEPAFKDLWFQSGCSLVIVWCALAFFKKMSEGGTG